MNAASTVLGLSELRSHVLEHVDAKSLYAAVRVSRSWAADALPHLWYHATEKALASCPGYGGFNYAAWVRELTVVAHFPTAQVMRHWPALPHLQRLMIGLEAVWDEFADDDSDGRGDFARLWDVCHSALSPLHVEIGVVWYPGYVLEEIWDGEPLPHRIYSLIASSGNAVSFRCRLYIDTEAIASAMATTHGKNTPFRSLKLLSARIASFSTPFLLSGPMLQSLTNLHLSIVAGEQNVLSAVACLVKLRILDLHFIDTEIVEFSADEVLGLSTLSELREVYVYGDGDVMAPDLTDNELAQLAACWPHLQVWDVLIYANFSSAAFRLMGEHCRELRELKMWGASTLCAFKQPTPEALTPLFPKLQTLTFDISVGLDPTGLEQAPVLKDLVISGTNPIEKLIQEHITKYRNTQLQSVPESEL